MIPMKKRWLAIFLAGAMTVSLAACGSTTSGSTETTDDIITSGVYVSTDVQCTVNAVGDNAITVTTQDDDQFTVNLSDSVQYSYTIPQMGDNDSAPAGSIGGAENEDMQQPNDSASANGSAPAMPEDNGTDMNNGADNQTPPEKPDGENSMEPSGSAPQMPSDGNGGSNNGGTPPEMPSGDMSQGQGGGSAPQMPSDENGGNNNGGTPPEMPSGDMSQGQGDGSAPQMPSDSMEPTEADFDAIQEGDTVTLTFDENGEVSAVAISMSMSQKNGPGNNSGMAGPDGNSGAVTDYTAANTYSEDAELTNETVTSTGDDENAILVQGGTVTMEKMSIVRDSDSSTGGDNSSFYGVGAAVLSTNGTAIISDSTITTDAKGGAGAFAYGDGTIYISDSDITTAQDTSGGVHVAGGGTLYAWNLNVETNGESSAAIRSDRGSGTMVVDGGTYTANGTGSPAIYSTADITVNDADLTANGSEAICIEGLNTIRLYDCDLTGNMQDNNQNDCTWNVILYQSMSGDSEQGNSTFEMVGGTLTAKNGGMFYTTNTESTFVLENVAITNAENSEFLLKCTGNSNARGWGSSGSNGADCTFTAIQQTLEGNIIWDSISNLNMYLTENSKLTGAIVDDESNAGNGGSGSATLTIDAGSTWIVTEDSILTVLNNAGTIVDANGNAVTIQGTDGTVYVQGNGSVTITVSSYNTTADLSGASQTHSFRDYEVNKAA